jgi:hypothetical protein
VAGGLAALLTVEVECTVWMFLKTLQVFPNLLPLWLGNNYHYFVIITACRLYGDAQHIQRSYPSAPVPVIHAANAALLLTS